MHGPLSSPVEVECEIKMNGYRFGLMVGVWHCVLPILEGARNCREIAGTKNGQQQKMKQFDLLGPSGTF